MKLLVSRSGTIRHTEHMGISTNGYELRAPVVCIVVARLADIFSEPSATIQRSDLPLMNPMPKVRYLGRADTFVIGFMS